MPSSSLAYWRSIILMLAIVGLLAGCATPERQPTAVSPLHKQAIAAEKKGAHARAAELYQQLAQGSSAEQRQEWLLKAAENFYLADATQDTQRIISELDITLLDTQQLVRRQLLVAQLAIDEGDYERARLALTFDIPPATADKTQEQIHKLRITTYNRLGDPLNGARAHIALDRLLKDSATIRFNQERLWQLLQSISSEELASARANEFNSDVSGWLELALIAQRFPQQAGSRIEEWRQYFPDHPAQDWLLSSILELQNLQALAPDHIALLLPLQGPLASAANAIRDGFFTAYYQDDHQRSPSIRLYDVSGADGKERDDIFSIYQNAVNEGAQFIVGPLSKQAVAKLAQRSDISVPVLALNYTEEPQTANNALYQFGLAPEDEARQAAERAWRDGHRQAAVMSPQGDWGERMRTAFVAAWTSLGGSVVENKRYDPSASDFSTLLENMLGLNQSLSRRRDLQRFLGLNLEFEPRRRKDIDFIYLAAFPRQGRLLKPQLKFHRAGDIPVYASSHIYGGKADVEAYRDIDDVMFCDSNWINDRNTSRIYGEINRVWPGQDETLRLYALGADAFNLIAQLHQLRRSPLYTYEGESGTLSLDEHRRLHRKLPWFVIKNGTPVALPSAAPL